MSVEVETSSGRAAGRSVDAGGRAVRVFYGLPYAAPPVGARRFLAPAAAQPWAGVRDATEPGAAPPQARGPGIVPGTEVDRTNEDCLTLDVWAPSGAERLPVMVWIPGGAFTSCWSASPTHHAARLAADGDVVVVSVNYRVGALGFCAFDGLPGNVGLRDQLHALGWIRENIEAFGGDPGSITLFGLSAGGGSILHLMASKASHLAYRRAIVQSGATALTAHEGARGAVADALAKELDVAVDDVSALQGLPVDVIVDAQQRVAVALFGEIGMMPFHPWIDGDLLDAAPVEALARGAAPGRPLIIGGTRDELRLYHDPAAVVDLDHQRLVRRVARYLTANRGEAAAEQAEHLVGAYEAERPSRSAGDIWADFLTDAEMTVPLEQAAIADSRFGHTWRYRFDKPAANEALGACHGLDLPYTFGTLDRAGWANFAGDDDGAQALSRRMRAAWTAFAHDGAPDTAGLPAWPEFDDQRRATMILHDRCRVVDDPDSAIRGSMGSRRIRRLCVYDPRVA